MKSVTHHSITDLKGTTREARLPGAGAANVELIERFIQFLQRNRGRSKRTAEIYCDALIRMATAHPEKSLLKLTVDELVLYSGAELHKQGVNAISRRPHIAAIRGFYAWAKRFTLIQADPATSSLDYPKRARKLPRAVTLHNAEKLMWSIDFSKFTGVRDAAMIGLLMGCGLRISGLLNLTREQLVPMVHGDRPRLSVRALEKGDKERLLPIPAEAEVMLRVYLEHPDLKQIDCRLDDGRTLLFVATTNNRCPPHLFHGERRRMSRKAVAQMLLRRGRKAGIADDQLNPHAMRHLYGTELAEENVDLLIRKELMGHVKAESTEIYERLAMRKKFEAVDRASPLAKMRTPVSDVLEQLKVLSSKAAK